MAATRVSSFNPIAAVNHTRNDIRLTISNIAKRGTVKAATVGDLHKWLASTLDETNGMTAFGKNWKPKPGETRANAHVVDQAALKRTLLTLSKALTKVGDDGFGTTAAGKDRTPTDKAALNKWIDEQLVKALKGNVTVQEAKGGKTRPATAAEIRQWLN